MPYLIVTCNRTQVEPILMLKLSLTSAMNSVLNEAMARLKLKKLQFLCLCFSDQIKQSVKGIPTHVPSLSVVQIHF